MSGSFFCLHLNVRDADPKSILRRPLSPNRFDAVNGQSKAHVSRGLLGVAQKLDVPHADIAQNLGSDASVFRVELGKGLGFGPLPSQHAVNSSANPPPCRVLLRKTTTPLPADSICFMAGAIQDPCHSHSPGKCQRPCLTHEHALAPLLLRSNRPSPRPSDPLRWWFGENLWH